MEHRRHLGIRLRTARAQVVLGISQRVAAVIDPVIDVHDVQLLVEQVNRRQKPVAVHPVGVQIVGLEVRGGDKTHAVFKQRR